MKKKLMWLFDFVLSRRRELFIMKNLLLLLVIFNLQVSANIMGQKVNLKLKNVSLIECLKAIEAQTEIGFLYNGRELNRVKGITLDVKDVEVTQVLADILAEEGYGFEIEDDIILISKLEAKPEVTVQTQQVQVGLLQGKVVDKLTGEPLVGVNVYLKGEHSQGTITDGSGAFKLLVDKDKGTLVFSFIGYEEQEHQFSDQKTNFTVMLVESVSTVDEVVVTGYQTISKERAAGSYAKVSTTELEQRPVTNLADALSGLATGLIEDKDSYGRTRFLIRGQGTFQSQSSNEQDPLIVVDGMPIQGYADINTGDKVFDVDPFAGIDPNDVESVTILKDAAATSIYGARAANGVIVITTKSAKKGDKMNVNFNAMVKISDYSDSQLEDYFNFAQMNNLTEFVERYPDVNSYYWTRSWNDPWNSKSRSKSVSTPELSSLVRQYKTRGDITEQEYNNGMAKIMANEGAWVDQLRDHVLQKSVTQQYSLSITGSNEKNLYKLAVTYENSLGNSIGDENENFRVNFSNQYEISKKLNVSVGVTGYYSKNKRDGLSLSGVKDYLTPYDTFVNDDGTYPHMGHASSSAIHGPIMDEWENTYNFPNSWRYNPVEERQYQHSDSKALNFRANAAINYEIIKGLRASVKANMERNTYDHRQLYEDESYRMRYYYNTYSELGNDGTTYETYFPAPGSFYTDNGTEYTSYTIRGQLDFNRRFGIHQVTALVGGEAMSSTEDRVPAITRWGYNENTNAIYTKPDLYTKVPTFWSSSSYYPWGSLGSLTTYENRFVAAYSNLAYTYNDKYTITASARIDASNFLSEKNRDKYSPFWSTGLVWNADREDFLSGVGFINYLKFRVSFGLSGIAAGKRSAATITTLSTTNGTSAYSNYEPYNRVSSKGNSDLTWEKSRTFNIGIDYSLFKRKLYGSLEYYDRYSYDVLARTELPYITWGTSSTNTNNAVISNRGIELTLGTNLKITKDLRWNGVMNLSYNKNAVLEHNAPDTRPSSYRSNYKYKEGNDISGVYLYNLTGITNSSTTDADGNPIGAGYFIMEGLDGSEQIVTNRNETHLYDTYNEENGLTFEDYQWLWYSGVTVAPTNVGFTSTFSYKALSLSMTFRGKFGHIFKRIDSFDYSNPNSPGQTSMLDIAFEGEKNNYSDGPETLPLLNEENKDRLMAGYLYLYMGNLHNASNALYDKADFIKLSNVNLSYNLPNRIFTKTFIKNVNLYANAQNLGCIWVKNKWGMDPEYPLGSMRPSTTFTFGAKLNF